MSRYTVQGEYLCEYVDHCTCGVGRGGYYGAHEPGCGLEPVGPIEQLLASQPVAPAPDTASVLAGLVQEMRTRAEQYDVQGTANTDLVAFGIARAINIVEAAQQRAATSGARAAGGDTVESGESNEKYRELRSAVDGELKLAGIYLDRDAEDIITEALIEHAEADRKVSCPDCMQWSWHGPDAERKVIEHYLKVHAAPPAPSAHGVAELLAECAREKANWPDYAVISCDQIVRLLAPEGADDERERRVEI